MKEINEENLDRALAKALPYLEIGPFAILRAQLDAELDKAGVTKAEMLTRALPPNAKAESGDRKGLAATYGPAANDDPNEREALKDRLAYLCEMQDGLKRAARIFAIGLVAYHGQKEVWGAATAIEQALGSRAGNVEESPTFLIHKQIKELKRKFVASFHELVERPLPEQALNIGLERFEKTILDEFREKSI